MVIRRVQAHGGEVLFSPYRSLHSLTNVPGLENYQVPIAFTRLTADGEQDSQFAKLVRDAVELGGGLRVNLSTAQDVTRCLESLPKDSVLGRKIDVIILGREITEGDLAALEGVPDLNWLALVNCKFAVTTGMRIENLRQVTDLNLDDSTIDDAAITNMRSMNNLHSLTLSNTQVSEAAKVELQQALPGLQLTDD